MTDDDTIPENDENGMPRDGDNFDKSERELGKVGQDLIRKFEKLHGKAVPQLQMIMIEFGRTLRQGRDLYFGDDIGFGDWVKRRHLDTGKIGHSQQERTACMRLAELHDDGVIINDENGEIARKLDLTGCNNTTPTDVMKWVRKTQRHLLPHLKPIGEKKKPAPKDKGPFEPDEEIGNLGIGNPQWVDDLKAENAKLKAANAALRAEPGHAPELAEGADLICSFCSKVNTEVLKMIRGNHALICDECVALCVDIIADKAAKSETKTEAEEDEIDETEQTADHAGLDWETGDEFTVGYGKGMLSYLIESKRRKYIITLRGAGPDQKLGMPCNSLEEAKARAEADYAERSAS